MGLGGLGGWEMGFGWMDGAGSDVRCVRRWMERGEKKQTERGVEGEVDVYQVAGRRCGLGAPAHNHGAGV